MSHYSIDTSVIMMRLNILPDTDEVKATQPFK
jgi:hypothetical protein